MLLETNSTESAMVRGNKREGARGKHVPSCHPRQLGTEHAWRPDPGIRRLGGERAHDVRVGVRRARCGAEGIDNAGYVFWLV
jgi:hypothetical protein